MIRSLLIGLVAGQRAMTPLAMLAGVARNRGLPREVPGAALLENPIVAAGAAALAAGEMAGDKMKTAPDRIVPAGLIARTATAGFAGAALAEPNRRVAGGVAAAAVAIGASYVGWRLRMAALRRYGQTPTGFVEDALVAAAGWAIAQPRRA